MSEEQHAVITGEQLARKLRDAPPDNVDPRKGYALVNVLGRDAFADEHIPGSINIPKDEIGEFERRFESGKEVVLYCASPECDASPQAAEALERRGFRRVVDYEGGMSDWKEAGREVEQGASAGS